MLDILCPDGALDVDEDPGGGVVQLDHDEGAPEPGLIAEGVEVAGETALRRVRHLGTSISLDTGCHIKHGRKDSTLKNIRLETTVFRMFHTLNLLGRNTRSPERKKVQTDRK